jgi:hypothetical protein
VLPRAGSPVFPNSFTGPPGPTGPTGSSGTNGTNGLPGSTGPPGTPGTVIPPPITFIGYPSGGCITTTAGYLNIGGNTACNNILLTDTQTFIGNLGQLQIYNDQLGLTGGTAVTLNSNLNIATSGIANFAFDINGYDSYTSGSTTCNDGLSTAVVTPTALISPGLYAIMSSQGSNFAGVNTMALFDGSYWTAGGGGAGIGLSGGGGGAPPTSASIDMRLLSRNIFIQNDTGFDITLTLIYIRLSGNKFNRP